MTLRNDILELFEEAQGEASYDNEVVGLTVRLADTHGNIELLRDWKANTPPTLMRAYKKQQNARAQVRGYYAAYRKTPQYKAYRKEYYKRKRREIMLDKQTK